MIKAEFSASLLQSSESHDQIILICWFGAQETFMIIIIISVQNISIFVKKIFFQDSLMNRKFRTEFTWNRILFYKYYIIHAFTVTFDQLNVTLLNKTSNYFQKISYSPQTFKQYCKLKIKHYIHSF